MNPKYQKILSDIEKAEKKRSEIEGQLKELYDKKTELENLEIINTVRSMVMDKAVSYTHLDVYKRQAHGRPSPRGAFCPSVSRRLGRLGQRG